MENLTPSPFLGTHEQFLDEIEALCRKYDYKGWAVFVNETYTTDEDVWRNGASVISDDLIDALEHFIEDVKEELPS